MRKKLLLIISLIMVSLSFFLGGCTKTEDKLEISFDQTEINFTYGMDTSKEVTLSLKNASENTDILFSETTKGIVNIVREDAEDKSWVKFTVTPKGTGSTRVIAYNATNSAIQAYFNVNVFQQVTDVYERKGVTLYCQVGGKLTLSANSHFNVSPDNANKGDLVYEKVEEGSTANVVVNRETGVIDATGADVVAGILKVKVYPWYNEDLAHILTIHVLKAISPSDVTLLRDSAPYELKHGVVNKIQLVKTKEEFAQTELVFSVSSDDNQIIEGTFEIANNAIAAIQQTDLTSFVVKSKELGATQVKFILNIQGVTNNAIAPLEYNFEIEVIDIPVDILLNGVSGKGVVHDLVIYNIYGENTLGQQLRFTLSPSSVIDKYANIVIALPAGAQDLISLFYEDGSEVDYSEGNRVIISADTTLYVSALPTVTTGTLEITAEAEISSLYDEPDELVRTTVRFTIKQGLSKLMFAHNNELYLPVGRTLNINLTVPEDELSNADTSRIICIDDYDKESITVDPTQNDLLFIVTAHKASTQALVFDSGNGHTARLILHVYNPLTSVKLETESIYENGSIGEKKYREDNKEILESIVVAVGTTLPVFIYTNDNATISRINREAKGSTISLNQDLVTVTSVGSSEYIVTVVGYTGDYEDFNEYPEEQDIEESFTLKITITGYVPISSITLTPLRATVYNAASVGYYKMDALSNLTLKSIIYPSSATTKDNVSWIIQEDPGFDKYTLTEVDNNTMIFSVKPSISAVIEETITIVVSISEYNRTYTQKCIITVLAAKQVTNIAFSNVIGNTITFDARKGLNEINSFKIQANVIPVDATNQNLRYHIVDEFGNFVKESNAIFSVTPDGIVTPLKGGVGYLRVAAEDSFDSANSPKMSVILEIIILDGKSEKTAFTISNVDELRAIGNSKETMSLYYVLADNIDIAQSKEWKNGWEPIGAKATVKESYPFTGQLSGRYVRKIYDSVTGEERELETNYCINNFIHKCICWCNRCM